MDNHFSLNETILERNLCEKKGYTAKCLLLPGRIKQLSISMTAASTIAPDVCVGSTKKHLDGFLLLDVEEIKVSLGVLFCLIA